MLGVLSCVGVPVDFDSECATCAYVTDHAWQGWIMKPHCGAREGQCFMGRHLCALDASGTSCYSPRTPPIVLFEYKDDRQGKKEGRRRSQQHRAVQRLQDRVADFIDADDIESLQETLGTNASPSPLAVAPEDTNDLRPVPVPAMAADPLDLIDASKDVWRDVPGGPGGLRERCTTCTIVVAPNSWSGLPSGRSCVPFLGRCVYALGARTNECFANVDRESCYDVPRIEAAPQRTDPARCGMCTHIASYVSAPDNLFIFVPAPVHCVVDVDQHACTDVKYGMQCAADADGTACIDLSVPPAPPMAIVRKEPPHSVFQTIVAAFQARAKALWEEGFVGVLEDSVIQKKVSNAREKAWRGLKKAVWEREEAWRGLKKAVWELKKAVWERKKAVRETLGELKEAWERKDFVREWFADTLWAQIGAGVEPPAACTGCTVGRVNGTWAPLAAGVRCTRDDMGNCWNGFVLCAADHSGADCGGAQGVPPLPADVFERAEISEAREEIRSADPSPGPLHSRPSQRACARCRFITWKDFDLIRLYGEEQLECEARADLTCGNGGDDCFADARRTSCYDPPDPFFDYYKSFDNAYAFL